MNATPTKSDRPRPGARVIATLKQEAAGLTLMLMDEHGKRPAATADMPVLWPISSTMAMDVLVPPDWLDYLETCQRRHQKSLLAPHLEAQRIPAFLHPPSGMEGLDWEYGFSRLTLNLAQPVRFAPSGPARRPPFNLPIDVVAVGEITNVMAKVQASSWYDEPEVREQGLVLESTTIGALRPELGKRTRDVVIAREADWQRVLTAVRSVAIADSDAMRGKEPITRPRLVILAAARNEEHMLPRRYSVPPGTALLVISYRRDTPIDEFLRRFFYGMFHDQPFHGALQEAEKPHADDVQFPALRAWLFADALSNHYIRISDALQRVENLRIELRYDAAPGDVDAFINRIREITPLWSDLGESLQRTVEASSDVRTAIDSSERLKVDFSRESRGLVPISHTLSQLHRGQPSFRRMRDNLFAVASNPEYAKVIARAQKRHVDIGLERHDRTLDSYFAVQPEETLVRRTQYRVRVHIGHRAENSLVVGDPPAIDPLLPELKNGETGYDLEVAIFEKDFELLSDRVASLYLPKLGGSKPVYFVISTLEENPAAELRVNVYHKNHLLQGFLLTAEVTQYENWRPSPASVVQLDVATSAAFGNMEDIRKRDLAISVNQDEDGVTHRIMVKKDGHAAHPVKLSDRLIEEQLKRFREILRTYTSGADNKPAFPTRPAPGDSSPPDFDAAIRSLATLGSDLYLGVFQEIESEISDDLREIRETEDLTIQVSRHRGNAVFPWPVMYDYRLPRKANRDTAPVCVGTSLPGAPSAPAAGFAQGCPHNPGRDVYCVQGFWGFRHRIEQITSGGAASDTALKIETSKAAHRVCLASSISQTAGTNLSAALKTAHGTKFVDFPPPPPPHMAFDTYMWQASSRPAVLVLLSHLSSPGSGKAQIMLVAGSAGAAVTLTANDVSEFTRFQHVWKEQPRSLVLLMACESGATTIATLNDFVMAFNAAGAAAIVGTEVPVYVSLAARFAEDLIAALFRKQADGQPTTLGKAVRAVANRLLGEGNPLGLVFNYCGNADLVLT